MLHDSEQFARCGAAIRVFAGLIFVLILLACPVLAATPTAAEIANRMAVMDAARASQATPYRVIRRYSIDYTGFFGDKHAEMVVQVVSNSPAKEFTIVSATGSKLLLNRVLRRLLDSEREASAGNNRREIKLSEDNYTFQLLGTEVIDGRTCYVLHVQPKRSNKFLYTGKVWVDAEDFAVTRIVATPAKNPSFWISSVLIEHRYQKQGDRWLPRSNRSTSKVRLGGRALLTIDYANYEFPGPVVSAPQPSGP